MLNYPGIYILTDINEDIVYIGSAYVRELRKRLLQYQQYSNSGNASLRQDLIDAGKTNVNDACEYIKNLTINAFKNDSVEYILIRNCEGVVNLVGKK